MSRAEQKLIAEGYEIRNAKITKAVLRFLEHGTLVFEATIEGPGWMVGWDGSRILGQQFYDKKAYEMTFQGSAKGLEYIMRIMDVVGVCSFACLEGSYVRVAFKDSEATHIGNILKDNWFSYTEFFEDNANEDQEHEHGT